MGTLIVLLVGVVTGIFINRKGNVTIVVQDKINKLMAKIKGTK